MRAPSARNQKLNFLDRKNSKLLLSNGNWESIKNFESLAPNQAKKEINLIINAIEKQSSQSNLLMEIQRII